MAKIRMTQTIAGCMDGIHPKKYIAEEVYTIDGDEINQRLANMFLGCNAAELIRERKPVLESPEKAVIEEAPEKKIELSVSEALKKASKSEVEQEETNKKIDEEEIDEEETKKETGSIPKAMRVFQLADKLKTPYKKIIKLANKLGIDVKVAQSGLTEEESNLIEVEFKK